jgi:hypothetical protein
VKEVRLELAFSRYETYEDKIREVYRPKGLLAFAAAAREYVRILGETDETPPPLNQPFRQPLSPPS